MAAMRAVRLMDRGMKNASKRTTIEAKYLIIFDLPLKHSDKANGKERER